MLTNKPISLGLSILELSINSNYEIWCDYVKPNYGEKSKTVFYGYMQFHSIDKNRWYL